MKKGLIDGLKIKWKNNEQIKFEIIPLPLSIPFYRILTLKKTFYTILKKLQLFQIRAIRVKDILQLSMDYV